MYSSIVSLVVPSISLTIALFSPSIKFKRDDLPTLGFPIIAVLIPSFKILPFSKLFFNFNNFSAIFTIFYLLLQQIILFRYFAQNYCFYHAMGV